MYHLPLPSTLMTCLAPAARMPSMAAWFRETTNAVDMVLYLFRHNQSDVQHFQANPTYSLLVSQITLGLSLYCVATVCHHFPNAFASVMISL